MKRSLALMFALGLALSAVAQDDKTAGQKSAVTANLTKTGIKKIATADTKNIQVLSTLSEARAKTIAEAAQKTFAFTHKALKLDDNLWPGKLTVVVLGDTREFSGYVRVVTQSRPDPKDWFTINVRGDVPTAAVFVEAGEKSKDAELTGPVSTIVAAALLNKKAGTSPTTGSLPEWVQLGFGKLMHVKTVGGAALADYRTKSKAVVVGTKSKPSPVRLASLWTDKNKDTDLVAASVVEYMMYGIEGDKFFAFAAGFKPNEMVAEPSVDSAFAGVEWKMAEFEFGWKNWLSKQK
ncbi:MAG: hypothetical protein KF873_04050 [Gemmataceae bacterium]|nr:hypothetical protein [Gemmataceae bacterium]